MVSEWLLAPVTGCACLDADHFLGWAIAADGARWPVIVDRRVTGTTTVALGADAAGALAPHEALGPLPAAWREPDRICGRPTASGAPCKIETWPRGAACRHHRKARR